MFLGQVVDYKDVLIRLDEQNHVVINLFFVEGLEPQVKTLLYGFLGENIVRVFFRLVYRLEGLHD